MSESNFFLCAADNIHGRLDAAFSGNRYQTELFCDFGSFFRERNARFRDVRSCRFAIAIEAEQCFALTIEYK